MGIIIWIIFGAFVGWTASLVMKTNSQQGIFLDVIIGIIGAVIGGWFMNLLGNDDATGFTFYGFIVALLGSCIFIAVAKIVRA